MIKFFSVLIFGLLIVRSDHLLKGKIKSIKTAVLWKKADSTFEPDFCAQRLKDNPWIVQPFEKYEEIRIEDLKKSQN